MKKIYLFAWTILFVIVSLSAIAQNGSLTGALKDAKSAPLAFANVSILKATDNKFVSGTLTSSDGKFTVQTPEAGKYILRFTSIGFAELKTEAFEVTGIDFSKDFGSITMKADVKTLQDVSVTALRPSIVQLADRMVVSVEGTAMAAGNTAYAVLSRAPGVFIDAEGNIQLNGKSGVTVMIDNKLTYLSAKDLRTMLEAMPAENLKNIEVITIPSSKYDAEGSSGILNLNLKKNTQKGMNGSVFTNYSYNFKKQHNISTGGTINYKMGKWNSFLTTDVARRAGGRDATFTRIFFGNNKATYFDQVAVGNFKNYGPPTVRLGTDYSFNNNHSLGAMASFVKNTGESEFLTDTYIGNTPKQPATYVEANNFSENTYRNLTTNLHYTGKLDTLGTLLTSDLDYVKITNRGESNFYNYYTNLATGQRRTDFLYTSTPNGYDIYSGKIDLTMPIKKVYKIETGLKASRVISDNNFPFYFNNNNTLKLDPLRSNHFKYHETIYAAYTNWGGPLSKKVSVQAGLRLEHTASLGNSITLDSITERTYTDIFPTVFLQHKISDNYGINYSYRRSLGRPNYGQLNPFRAYRDPYTWYEGNTGLRPQYSNAISITQVINRIYSIALNLQKTKDAFAEIPILQVADTTTIYTHGNVSKSRSAGLTAVGPFKIMKKWDTQNTLVLTYNRFETGTNLGYVVNDQLFAMIQSNQTILLPRNVKMELNIMLRGPGASGLYRIASMHRIDVAFKKSILNKKVDVSMGVIDLFKGFRYLWTTDIGGQVNDFDQYFRTRVVNFSLRYNFSRGQKVEQKRRSATAEEVNRT
jgi:hypothetical protein